MGIMVLICVLLAGEVMEIYDGGYGYCENSDRDDGCRNDGHRDDGDRCGKIVGNQCQYLQFGSRLVPLVDLDPE